MIPDFKTYIKESVWGDIHKRSNGIKVRKEDDIDNMTLQRFYDYWHERYNVIGKTGGAWKDMECMHNPIKRENVFSTPIEYTHYDGFTYTYCVEMTYDYRVEEIEELRITYFSSFILDYPDFKDVFGPEYNVDDSGNISIVNGKYKFHHYIDIIDKCVSMVKKPYVEIVMNESVWADIHKRSSGTQVRKEDNPYSGRDINSLSGEEFCDYLTYRYEILESDILRNMYSRSISVPLYLFSGYRHLSITYSDKNKNKIVEVSIVHLTPRLPAGLYKKLSERFDLEYNKKFMITNFLPKDGNYTNSYCLEIIDFILENTDCRGLMKKKEIVSESVWGDIHKRSSGIQVRKEDDANNKDIQEFVDYLNELYDADIRKVKTAVDSENCQNVMVTILRTKGKEVFIQKSVYGGWPIGLILKDYYGEKTIIFSNKSFPRMCPKLYHKLEDVLTLDIDKNDTVTVLSDKGKITNQFFIYVLNTIIDNLDEDEEDILIAKNEKLSESIWADIHKRSNGTQVRKEDDVNLLDRDGFYKYLMEHYKTSTEDVTSPYAISNSKNSNYIGIPIFEDDNNTLYRVGIWNFNKGGMFNEDSYITIPIKEPFWGSKLFVKIRDTFELKVCEDQFNPLFKVFPKDNKKVNNRFFLEVIDFIIDNVEEPFESLLTRL